MENSTQLNASLILYADDEMDAEILDWLNSLPRRRESGSSRERVCRRGITREFRQALYEYAERQNARKASRSKRNAPQGDLQSAPSPVVPAPAAPPAASVPPPEVVPPSAVGSPQTVVDASQSGAGVAPSGAPQIPPESGNASLVRF
jgi:hypothetical protein